MPGESPHFTANTKVIYWIAFCTFAVATAALSGGRAVSILLCVLLLGALIYVALGRRSRRAKWTWLATAVAPAVAAIVLIATNSSGGDETPNTGSDDREDPASSQGFPTSPSSSAPPSTSPSPTQKVTLGAIAERSIERKLSLRQTVQLFPDTPLLLASRSASSESVLLGVSTEVDACDTYMYLGDRLVLEATKYDPTRPDDPQVWIRLTLLGWEHDIARLQIERIIADDEPLATINRAFQC